MTPTAGPVHVYHWASSTDGRDLGLYEVEEANEQITDLRDSGKDTEAIAVAEANVELIKQAFDTCTETGLTPREQAGQRDALLAENAKLKSRVAELEAENAKLKTVNEALLAACKAFIAAVNPECPKCHRLLSIAPDGLSSWFDFQCRECGTVGQGKIFDAVQKATDAIALADAEVTP